MNQNISKEDRKQLTAIPQPTGFLSLSNPEVALLPAFYKSHDIEKLVDQVKRSSDYIGYCEAGLVIIVPMDDRHAKQIVDNLIAGRA